MIDGGIRVKLVVGAIKKLLEMGWSLGWFSSVDMRKGEFGLNLHRMTCTGHYSTHQTMSDRVSIRCSRDAILISR